MNLSMRRDGLAMKIARYGGLEDERRTDLCSVTRALVWGLIRAPFWTVCWGFLGAGAIGFFVGLPIIGLIAWLLEGLAADEFVWTAVVLWVIAICFAYEAWAVEEHKASPICSTVRFAKAGYRSWKDKTCVLVDIE